MLLVDVLTIFPEMFPGVLGSSMLKRAQENGRLRIAVHDLRDYSHDKHRKVDDRPYGGGPGMIMRIEPICEAVEVLKRGCAAHRRCQTILMSPQGQPWSSTLAQELAGVEHAILICGHYEGVDERVKLSLADREISIGDYVLTGGELPAMVLMDCVARFIPGVLGHAEATAEESFKDGWLEYPQYTRPPVFKKMRVPAVLRSGDHERIARWRKRQSVARTRAARPDLVKHAKGSGLRAMSNGRSPQPLAHSSESHGRNRRVP